MFHENTCNDDDDDEHTVKVYLDKCLQVMLIVTCISACLFHAVFDRLSLTATCIVKVYLDKCGKAMKLHEVMLCMFFKGAHEVC